MSFPRSNPRTRRCSSATAPSPPAAIAKHKGPYLVRGGASEVVEGGPPAKTIMVLEFPSMADAKAWYESADYAEARAIGRQALRRRLIFIEGVPPD